MSNINNWYTVVSTQDYGVSIQGQDGFKYYLHPNCPVEVGDEVWLWNSGTASMGRPEGVREGDEGVIQCWLCDEPHWVLHRKDYENALFSKMEQEVEALEEHGKICEDFVRGARTIFENLKGYFNRGELKEVDILRDILDHVINKAWDVLEEEYELQLDQAAMERNWNNVD